MPDQFTIGIEEEYQLVDLRTGELRSCAHKILEKAPHALRDKLKPEIFNCMVEYVSSILPDMPTARRELYEARAQLSELVAQDNLALIAAGTHPTADWWDHPVTPKQRYFEIVDEFQEVGRSLLIFGLHVHVAVEPDLMFPIMNQVRTWLPHLLALSANSPFSQGRDPGIKSFRSVIWSTSPRSGLPEVQASREAFDAYVQMLIASGRIDNAKKIWWDLRPHPFYGTLEFRICDMPTTIEDVLALAALTQALVAKLIHLNRRGQAMPVWSKDYIDENKWRAVRDGLDAVVIDFERQKQVPMRQCLRELLDFVREEAEAFGSHREMGYLRELIESPEGSGADRQLAIYRQSGDWLQVRRHLIQQTMHGIDPKFCPWQSTTIMPELPLSGRYEE